MGLAWALVPIPSPVGAEYHFLDGAGGSSSDPISRSFTYAGIGASTLSFVSLSGTHLERWPGVGAAKMPARTLRVLMPAQAPTQTMLVHDGQNLFGPTRFGGWGLQEAAGSTTLVVGIDNTKDPIADEYTPVSDTINSQTLGGKGNDYADYVENIPALRRGASRKNGPRGSDGQLARRYPASYELAASRSGTVGCGSIGPGLHNLTEIQAWGRAGRLPHRKALARLRRADNFCENVQMRDPLLALGCGSRLSYVFSSGSPHNAPAWRGA